MQLNLSLETVNDHASHDGPRIENVVKDKYEKAMELSKVKDEAGAKGKRKCSCVRRLYPHIRRKALEL